MLPLLAAVILGAPVVPLLAAHAHNDYVHARPLYDALDHGFCSIEADLFRVGDEILVAHERETLDPTRTLRKLYLDPLRERVRQNRGRVYRGGPPVFLLLDIKEDGRHAYVLLKRMLYEYRSMLTEVRDNRVITRAVTVVISGDCPREDILVDRVRYAGIDGRLSDLNSKLPAHAMPLLSDRWPGNFTWFGLGPMPDSQREKLRDIVRKAHEAGRRVRFWATPESEALWQELLNAGVDLIGTDDLPRLATFLRARKPAPNVPGSQRR